MWSLTPQSARPHPADKLQNLQTAAVVTLVKQRLNSATNQRQVWWGHKAQQRQQLTCRPPAMSIVPRKTIAFSHRLLQPTDPPPRPAKRLCRASSEGALRGYGTPLERSDWRTREMAGGGVITEHPSHSVCVGVSGGVGWRAPWPSADRWYQWLPPLRTFLQVFWEPWFCGGPREVSEVTCARVPNDHHVASCFLSSILADVLMVPACPCHTT